MNRLLYILIFILTAGLADVSAQVDKREVRRGNRDFKKENFKEAELDYFRGLAKDSLSFAANYNMANTLYRQGNYDQALKHLEKIAEMAADSPAAADYYYNLGNVAMAKEDYQKAVDAYKQSLLRNPSDLEAKENYIYAKEKLKQQQNQDQQQQNQDKDQQQQDQQNQDQQDQQDQQNQQDQQQQQQEQKEDKQDQNKDQQEQDQKDQQQNQQQQQQNKNEMSKENAQQLLNAVMQDEKNVQDKVKKQIQIQGKKLEKDW